MEETSTILLRLGQVAGKQEAMEKEVAEMRQDIGDLREGQHRMARQVGDLSETIKLALKDNAAKCDRRHPDGTDSFLRKKSPSTGLSALTKAGKGTMDETLGQFFARIGVKVLEGALIAMGLALFYFAAKLVGAI